MESTKTLIMFHFLMRIFLVYVEAEERYLFRINGTQPKWLRSHHRHYHHNTTQLCGAKKVNGILCSYGQLASGK